MKFYILVLVILMSLPCFAGQKNVRVGDSVEYDYRTAFGTNVILKWSVISYDPATATFSTTYEVKNGGGLSFPGTFSNESIQKLGSTKKTYRDCNKLGGVYETLKTAMGYLSVCHLYAGYQDERWVAKEIRCSDAKGTIRDTSGYGVVATVRSYNCH